MQRITRRVLFWAGFPLLMYGVAQATRQFQRTSREAALISAAERGDTRRVEQLLKLGVSVETRAKSGSSALQGAAFYGHLETIRRLLAGGADPNGVAGESYSAVFLASAENHYAVAEYLLTHGGDPNFQHAYFRSTALMSAAMEGDVRMTRILLRHGALLSPRDWRGQSALDFARKCNRWAVVKLLEQAMDAENRPKQGSTRPRRQ